MLFTGHRIDDPGRTAPRFPPSKEDDVKRAIEAHLAAIASKHPSLAGISGAASGGDILFHEACIARGIPSVVYLALPPDEYARHSVQPAGSNWLVRFHELLERRPVRVMPDSAGDVWQRANLWMLSTALADGGHNMTLLALWNGQAGDGPGGTADMIDEAARNGATVLRVARELFEERQESAVRSG